MMILRTLPFEWLVLPCTLVDWSSSSYSQRMSLEREYCVFFSCITSKLQLHITGEEQVKPTRRKLVHWCQCLWNLIWCKSEIFFWCVFKSFLADTEKIHEITTKTFHHDSFFGRVPWAGFNTAMAPTRIYIRKYQDKTRPISAWWGLVGAKSRYLRCPNEPNS